MCDRRPSTPTYSPESSSPAGARALSRSPCSALADRRRLVGRRCRSGTTAADSSPPASAARAATAAFVNVKRAVGREHRIDGRADLLEPGRHDLVAACDQRLGHVLASRAGPSSCAFSHHRADHLVGEARHDPRRPERIVRPHVVEGRVGIFGLPFHRVERLRLEPADRRRHVGIVDQHPRPDVDAERRQRQPSGALLEDVFVAGPMALGVDGAAAEDRAEVEHVVLDPGAAVRRSPACRGC